MRFRKLSFLNITSDDALGKMSLFLILLMFFGFQIQVGLPYALNLPTQPFSIAYRAFPLALSLFMLLVIITKKSYRFFTLGTILIIGFWIFYALRVAYDIGYLGLNEKAFPFQTKIYYFLYVYGSGLIPVLAIVFSAKHINFKRDGWWVLLFSGIQILVSFYLLISNFDTITEEMLKYRTSVGSEEGNVLNPITLAKFGAISFLLGFAHIMAKAKRSLIQNLLFLVFIIVGIFFVVLGGSRGPVLALVIGALLMIYYHFYEHKLTAILFIRWSVVLVLIIFAALFYIIPKIDIENFAVFYRVVDTVNNSSGSGGGEERVNAWSSAWNQFVNNPILGDQMFETFFWQYPHNVILESLMATGLIGGLLFISLYVYSLYKLVNLKRNQFAYKSIGTFCLVSLVISMSSGGLYFNSEMWSVLAFLAGSKIT